MTFKNGSPNDSNDVYTKNIFLPVLAVIGGIGALLMTRYKISKPNEYIVKTGLGI
jgi:hypothetical protein